MLSFVVNTVLTALVFYNIHHSFKNTSKAWKKFYKHYFVVFSILIAVDNLLSFILYYIPYYQVLKVLLIGWISIPNGTGPHFIYNVYIKNIHRLFEGDIDAVFESSKKYFETIKAKYYEMVNSRKMKVEIGFKNANQEFADKGGVESSEADASTHAVSEPEDEILASKSE